MNEKLAALWNKVLENKDMLVKVGSVLIGSVAGGLIVKAAVEALQDEPQLVDEE